LAEKLKMDVEEMALVLQFLHQIQDILLSADGKTDRADSGRKVGEAREIVP